MITAYSYIKHRLFSFFVLLGVFSFGFTNGIYANDPLLSIMQSELRRNYDQMKVSGGSFPYFMSYRVDDVSAASASASFGSLQKKTLGTHKIACTPMVRLGSLKKDSYHENDSYRFDTYIMLPIKDKKGDATRMTLWKGTQQAWNENLDMFVKINSNAQVSIESEDQSDDYSMEKPVTFIEKRLTTDQMRFDTTAWEQRIKEYSAIFKEYPEIQSGTAQYVFENYRKYYVSTEGTQIVQNLRYARLIIQANVVADDGMRLPLYNSYFAFTPDDLTDHKTILRETRALAEKLIQLRTAPVGDSYTGPAILSAEASGVFFHEIFGHRIEGQRLKSESDGQTFKKRLGEEVLPVDLSVSMDPTLRSYNGRDLNGFYLYDEEGVKAQKVEIVKNGILKGFLMSRVPIAGFPASNGHGRAAPGKNPVTRQSNLIVTTTAPKTDDELRTLLKAEVKKQGKDYGYYFAKVSGGFTQTGRVRPNAFNITPLEVYRVFADERQDELVRGVTLIGTPLSMFSQISNAGDTSGIFTGICGAESGEIPVTAISPKLFIKNIETQKASKSSNMTPILPRP
ncbi:MAG: metallopeptidase TldD-related protein [Bacteroidales bacterium]|nr:metallopeptidase TldD-related protein [Bacteroidales bacterium]